MDCSLLNERLLILYVAIFLILRISRSIQNRKGLECYGPKLSVVYQIAYTYIGCVSSHSIDLFTDIEEFYFSDKRFLETFKSEKKLRQFYSDCVLKGNELYILIFDSVD